MAEVAGQTSLVSMNLNFDSSKKLQWPVAGRELNGWAPKISLREGLVPTIEYFKKTI